MSEFLHQINFFFLLQVASSLDYIWVELLAYTLFPVGRGALVILSHLT